MKTRKNSLLRWVAMIELVLGAYDLMNGLMSAFVLITDLEGVTASFTESGVEFSVPILVISVAITCIGGLIMVLAGAMGMIFASIPGKQKLPLYCGYGLFAFVIGYTDRIYGSWSSFVHASLLSSPWTLYVGSCKE